MIHMRTSGEFSLWRNVLLGSFTWNYLRNLDWVSDRLFRSIQKFVDFLNRSFWNSVINFHRNWFNFDEAWSLLIINFKNSFHSINIFIVVIMIDTNLFQVQTAWIDCSIGLKFEKISGHGRVLFDHSHGIGKEEGLDGFCVIEFEADQKLFFNNVVFDSVNDRDNEFWFLFEESLVGGVEISWDWAFLFGPVVDSKLMSGCIGFG